MNKISNFTKEIYRFCRFLISVVRHSRFRHRLVKYNNKKTILSPYLEDSIILIEKKDFGTSSELIKHNFKYEEGMQFLMKKIIHENDCIIELGANIGMHTLLLSKLAKHGKVYAFEPNSKACERLNANLTLNNCKNVQVIQKGAYSYTGEKEFHTFFKNSHSGNYSFKKEALETLNIKDEISTTKVDITKIDDFVTEYKISPNFIKIDIEGSEFECFEGMVKTINNFKPIIIFESNLEFLNKEKLRQLDKILSKTYNLHLLDLTEYMQYPIAHFFKIPQNKSLDLTDLNNITDSEYILCIPKNKFTNY